MQTRRRVLSVISAMALWCVGGCTERSGTSPALSLPARALNNVHYGVDAAQVMDVQLPAGRSVRTAVVVFIHGGAWEGGDKAVFTPTDISKFVAQGYACVNINYRLASVPLNIHDPLLSNDVTAALDYVAQHATDYVVAPSTFALVGHSAGAHLALLAAYRYDPQHRIKAVVSLSGPTDLTAPSFLAIPDVQGILERYLGSTKLAQPAQWAGASPVAQATSASPPTLIVHGQLDGLVPYAQAAALHARLVALKVPDDYRLFPSYDHDLTYVTLGYFPNSVWDPTLAWFATYLK